MLKLDIGNDLEMTWFGVKRSQVGVKIGVRVKTTAIRRGFELHECLLVNVDFRFFTLISSNFVHFCTARPDVKP